MLKTTIALFCALLFASGLFAGGLRAADSTVIYDDALQNGWVSYGWATLNFSSAATVHTGTHSISVTDPTSTYEALSLHHDAFDSSPYQSLTFWINGGPTAGQTLGVQAQLNGVAQAAVALPKLTNGWQQITLTLLQLGAANQPAFDGFWIQNISGGPAPTFYVDDIALIAAAAPTQIQISVDATHVIRTIDERLYGMNIAMWDSLLSGAANDGILSTIGTRVVRFPGGSLSDDYDWQTDLQVSTHGGYQWPNTAATFAQVTETRGIQAYITVNYGSGTPEQAAAWVAYYNADAASAIALGTDAKGRDWKTAGYWAGLRASAPLAHDDGFNFLRTAHPAPYGFKYWEIGNEIYGTWEYDQHGVSGSGLTGKANDAATYAGAFKTFYAKMLAVDATIKIGAVFDAAFVNQLAAQNATPHFIIYHRYPQNAGEESDATLLQSAGGAADDAVAVRNVVNSAFGAVTGGAMELAMTELNSTSAGVGKQSVSLVNALFMADSLGFVAQSEFNACMWWDLRNGTTSGNNSSALYGWRQFGDYGMLASGDRDDTPANTPYPMFYASKLLTHWGRGGDFVVAAQSNYPLLSAHAAHLANGDLALLVINRGASTDQTVQVALTGFAPDASASIYQYGKPNDLVNGDLTSSTFSAAASTFSYVFPAYSMSVVVLHAAGPGAPPPIVPPPVTPPPVGTATPPMITSTPAAVPNPAAVGASVAFSVAATGTGLTYAWNFGDGTSGTGSSPVHTYTSAGTFTATVTVSGDTGTPAVASTDVVVTSLQTLPLTLAKLCIKLNFARGGQDTITLWGNLPIAAGFAASGQAVTVNVGGVAAQFVLNARGTTARGNSAFQLNVKSHRGTVAAQNAAFVATLTRGNFSAQFSTFGLTNAQARAVAVSVPVTLVIDGKTYTKTQALVYNARAGSSGTAK